MHKDAIFITAAEAVALDRCSRLFTGMRLPEQLDGERASRVLRMAATGRRLAYKGGTLVPETVIMGASRFLGLAVAEPLPQAIAA